MATRSNRPGQERGVVKQPHCPYLVRSDAQQKQVAPVDYPSFENQCLAIDGEAALPLTEQATFCLSGSYRLCERYVNIQLMEPLPAMPAMPAADVMSQPDAVQGTQASPWSMTEEAMLEAEWPGQAHPPSWAWASAAVVFAAVLLVGGGIAAYMGWQLVQQGQFLARTGQGGQISTLGAVQDARQAPTFLVVTATSDQPLPAQPTVAPQAPVPVADQANNLTPSYPEAVTPTPIVLLPPAADQAQTTQTTLQQPPAPTTAPANLLLPPVVANGAMTTTNEALINVLEEVPTRRPTPTFELPTSTPVPLDPTATATLMILGTPVIIFGPDETSVPPGECTKIRWHVANVREVYYENQPAFGDGVQEECIDDEADSYALRVILSDGQTQIFTTTVSVLWPTFTPTLTPSFTPEPLATETWTPAPPTATPTPNVVRAVALRLNGNSRQTCQAGTECEVAILATNMGDSTDTISVEFLQRGNANAWLCRQDGVCAEQKLSLSNVGPGNTAFILLRITLPADSAGNIFGYVLRAISDGSQGTMTSEAVTIEIESQAP